jgi:hypothetical protein
MTVRVSNGLLDETPLGQFNQFNVGVDADKQALAFCAPTQTRMSGYEVRGQISIARSDSVTKIPIPKETGVFEDNDRAEQLVLTDGRLELYKLDEDEIEDLDTRLSESAPTVSTAEGDVDLDEPSEDDTPKPDREAEIEQESLPDDIDYPVFANVVVEKDAPNYEIEIPEVVINASQYEKGDRLTNYAYFDIGQSRISKNIDGYGDFDLREHPIEFFPSGNPPEEDLLYQGAPLLSDQMTVPRSYSYDIGDPLTLMVKRDGTIGLRPVNWDVEKEEAMWSELRGETGNDEQGDDYDDHDDDADRDSGDRDSSDRSGEDEKDQVTLAVDEVMESETDGDTEPEDRQHNDIEADDTTETDEADEIAIADALVSERVTVEESPTIEGSHVVPLPEAIVDASKFDPDETLVMYSDFGEVYSTVNFTDSDEYGDFDLADYPVGYYRSGEQPDGLQYHTITNFSKSLSVPKAYGVAIGDDLVLAVDETGSYVTLTASDEGEPE